jgi:hypothetical protein
MKKHLSTAIVSMLLVTISFAVFSMVEANPVAIIGQVDTDYTTQPPVITTSIENGTVFNVNNITLGLTVSIGDSKTASSRVIRAVYYGDWESRQKALLPAENTSQDWYDVAFLVHENSSAMHFNVKLTEVPDGEHNMTFYAKEVGAVGYPVMWVLEYGVQFHFTLPLIPKPQ